MPGQAPTKRPDESMDDFHRRRAAWRLEQYGYEGTMEPTTYPGGTSATPTPAPRYSAGQPVMPNPADYWVKQVTHPISGETITVKAEPNEPGAWIDPSYNTDLAEYQELVAGPPAPAPPAWRPGEYGLKQETQRQDAEAQEATNMANYLEALARGIENDIAAGTLRLAQAAEEFDRRLDAFAEAGSQMANMWQWTVPKGSAGKPLHADIREGLGMRPWISDPTEFDPWEMAQGIIDAMPPMSPVPSTDPYGAAVGAAESLLG